MSNVVEFRDRTRTTRRPGNRRLTAYAELAVTTNFSFLRGASHPKEFIQPALRALGLDRHRHRGPQQRRGRGARLSCARKQWNEHARTKAHGHDQPPLKLVVGARLVFADGTPDILAYPQNRTAWGHLTRLLTVGKSRGEKAECILYFDDLLEHIAGLNLIVMPPARHRDRTRLCDYSRAPEVCDRHSPSGSPPACSIAATTTAGSRA